MCRMMAPFTPFLMEPMYQNLRQLLTAEQTTSIHYLMIPQANMGEVDVMIEQSVASMQVVIELGRVIRDRKVMPVKELNVKELVVKDDEKPYGVCLKGQPDSDRLGKR